MIGKGLGGDGIAVGGDYNAVCVFFEEFLRDGLLFYEGVGDFAVAAETFGKFFDGFLYLWVDGWGFDIDRKIHSFCSPVVVFVIVGSSKYLSTLFDWLVKMVIV